MNRKQILLLLALVLTPCWVLAQGTKLQAAYTYQFTKFIEWCADGKSGDFKIAVVGNNTQVFKELVRLSGRNVGSQTIAVVEVPSVSAAGNCNLLYIPSNSGGAVLGQAVSGTQGRCTLIVSETEGDYSKGAGISFAETGGKLGFEVNTTDLANRGFKVSDQLIKLAKTKK